MPSPGMLHHVALVRTDILEEHATSIIRVTRIGKIGSFAVTSNQSMLVRNTICSSETSLNRRQYSSYVKWFKSNCRRKDIAMVIN
jgi:hypothetical protein